MRRRKKTSRLQRKARRKSATLGLHGIEPLEPRNLLAVDFELLGDLNPTLSDQGSDPQSFVQVGSLTFFSANSAATGTELWRTDGTTAGTSVIDIREGFGSSFPDELINVGGTLFFSAQDEGGNKELWKSDGTVSGTVQVKNIFPAPSVYERNSSPSHLTNVNGTLFFSANDGVSGYELWKSDGTEAGTTRVADIAPGLLRSSPESLVNVDGTLFFTANDGTSGLELWKSDGTELGTTRVDDIEVGTSSSFPRELTNVDGTLVFTAYQSTHGRELWKSDGTTAGTERIADIAPGSGGAFPTSLTNVGGTVYFQANDFINGAELWKSDGTAAGTVLVKDIRTGTSGSNLNSITNVGGTVFFQATDGVTGAELWSSDGTDAGTTIVSDIFAGSSSSYAYRLTNVGGTLFFAARDGANGTELWKSDGTSAGTTLVNDINSGANGSNPNHITGIGTTLYFSADNGGSGVEPWTSDGTSVGTSLLKDIRVGSAGSNPYGLTDVSGDLFFAANDGAAGNELWKTDGTAAGTNLVLDLQPGPYGAFPYYLTNVSGTLFFTTGSGPNTGEIWSSDGTSAGTSLVADIYPGGYTGSYPYYLTNVNGTLFFTADDGGYEGRELWKTDGTGAGTLMVADINQQYYESSYPYGLTNVGGILYFQANDGGAYEYQLFRSDGTAAGTYALVPSTTMSDPANFTDVNGTVFFSATGADGRELWKTDGTAAGTVLVKDIYSGAASSSPRQLTNIDGTLFFAANDGTHGHELWKSDGTAAGTVLVEDVRVGIEESRIFQITDVGGTAFFRADDGTNGIELWKSDGTSTGTSLVSDIYAGSKSARPSNFTMHDGTLYFSAHDETLSNALWRINSSTQQAERLSDPASNPPQVRELASAGGDLFAVAISDAVSTELYRINESLLDAVDDSFVGPDSDISFNVFTNDTPPTGVIITATTEPSDGTLVDNGDGFFTYTPDPGFSGTDTFDYTIAYEPTELISGTASGGDRFGYSVDVDGDFAVVGSFLDDAGGITNSGSAFVYQRQGPSAWTQVAQLNGDLDATDAQGQFGWSVSIDGDTVVVSAQKDRDVGFQAGAAYVFQRNEGGADNWGRVTKIVGSDTVARDLFGRSIDVSGDTVVVSASVADPVGASSGAAYVFERNQGGAGNWGQVTKLTGSDQAAGDRFGQSVTIDGDLIAVGAFRHDGAGTDSGTAYVFERNQGGANTWGEIKTIEASDAAASDRFGFSLSIDGSTLAVGSPLDDTGGLNQLGSVYVYSQDEGGTNNWGQVTKLLDSNGAAGDRLGLSVAVEGNRIVAGSPQADGGGNSSGRAVLFEDVFGTWAQSRVLTNEEVTTADEYGISVAVSGNTAIVGSWLDNRPGNNSGGAYAFDLQTDTATVTVNVIAAPSESPLVENQSEMMVSEMVSVSYETVTPSVLHESPVGNFAAPGVQTSVRDRVFIEVVDGDDADDLETSIANIAEARLRAELV
ncbi:Ig-like domain-containing protein [Rubripirellula amarantea]|nr:Ig-like domain-containing protein [Rubripirellula amarantea]